MNIVIIGSAHPFRGGIALFSERLAQQFQSEDHEVEIITFTTQYPNILFPGKTQFSDAVAPNNLKISRKINSTALLNWLKVGKQLRKTQPDVVIFNYWIDSNWRTDCIPSDGCQHMYLSVTFYNNQNQIIDNRNMDFLESCAHGARENGSKFDPIEFSMIYTVMMTVSPSRGFTC